MLDPTDPRAARFGLVVLTGINLFNYLDRFVVAGVEESIKHDLGLSDSEAGLLVTSFTIVYMLVAPFFGALGDRRSRTHLIAFGVALWSLATGAAGFAAGFLSLFVARAVVGIGEAAYGTIGPTLLSDYYPRSRRGRIFSIFYMAIPIGSALGYVLGGFMDRHFGWRAAFLVAGLPGLALALLALKLLDPPRGAQEEGDGPAPATGAGGWSSYLSLLGNRPYVLTVLGYAAYTFALGGLAFWGPAFLSRERGLERHQAAIWFGAILVVAGFLGTFIGGWLGDALLRRTRQAYLWVSGISSLIAVPVTYVALTAPDRGTYLSAIFVAEVLLFASTGPINTAIVNLVSPAMRAAAMAGSIFAIHLLGDAISPWIIGRLSDASSLSRAVLVVPLAILVGALIWCFGAWSAGRDGASQPQPTVAA